MIAVVTGTTVEAGYRFVRYKLQCIKLNMELQAWQCALESICFAPNDQSPD